MKIKAVLLCKKKSQRLRNKNIRKFANFNFGLLELKIKQLLKVKLINEIIISTDDEKIHRRFHKYHKKLKFFKREKKLCFFKTRTEELIKHITDLIPNDKILWTQVSSPLVDEKIYSKAIKFYKRGIRRGFDSLMSVTPIKQFFWSKSGPLNYKITKRNKWPRTQDLDEIYHINSAIFIFDKNIYKKRKDRVGKKPLFFSIKDENSIDIDNYFNFKLGEILYKSKRTNEKNI